MEVLLFKVSSYCSCFVGTGIIVVDADVLGAGGWTLTFQLLDNFGYICLGVVGTSNCALFCQNIYFKRPFVTEKYSKHPLLALKVRLADRMSLIFRAEPSSIATFADNAINMPRNGELQTQKLKVPSVKHAELEGSPFKAWDRSVYSHTCYAYCQGFLPSFYPSGPFTCIFFQNLP